MTGRDRIVIMAVVVLVVLAGAWIEVVSPKRQQASKLTAQVAAARSQLENAEAQVAHARAAQSQYASAYASMVSLGKAVPTSQEVPALIDQLATASDERRVDFSAISASAASGSSAAAASAASTTTGGFTQLPFTFTFEGGYFELERLFRTLTDFATLDGKGNIDVSGRLLTIQSVKLSPASSSSGASSKLQGSITATAYVLPAEQTATGTGAAAATPAAGAATTSAASASSTPPAVVRVNP
ncbi:MAG TPA: type 4a pilus biogenesis protein PilO [Solirubrobacteraceae bacterium]|nr:type 4a pilus biogenesis protein PilO [Solirubrobacteraceae bacterium]